MSSLPVQGELVEWSHDARSDEPTHQAVALRRELAIERSANAALLATLGELERALVAERDRVDALEAELDEVDVGDGAELARQRTVTRNLLDQLEEARQALEAERTKPLARRLLGR